MKTRANKGGEIGRNGEFYAGGQFLPSSELPKTGNLTERLRGPKKARKMEIEPYKWEVCPEGMIAIYQIFAGVYGTVRNGEMIVECSEGTLNYFQTTREEVQELADLYNSGERWFSFDFWTAGKG